MPPLPLVGIGGGAAPFRRAGVLRSGDRHAATAIHGLSADRRDLCRGRRTARPVPGGELSPDQPVDHIAPPAARAGADHGRGDRRGCGDADRDGGRAVDPAARDACRDRCALCRYAASLVPAGRLADRADRLSWRRLCHSRAASPCLGGADPGLARGVERGDRRRCDGHPGADRAGPGLAGADRVQARPRRAATPCHGACRDRIGGGDGRVRGAGGGRRPDIPDGLDRDRHRSAQRHGTARRRGRGQPRQWRHDHGGRPGSAQGCARPVVARPDRAVRSVQRAGGHRCAAGIWRTDQYRADGIRRRAAQHPLDLQP